MKAKNKLIALVLSLVMVFSAVVPSVALTVSVSGTNGSVSVSYSNSADTNNDGIVYYVAIGDSIGTGYGTEQSNDDTAFFPTLNVHASPVDSYPYFIAEKLFGTLKENGLASGSFSYYTEGQKNLEGEIGDAASTMTGFGWANCAIPGYSADDYYSLLTEEEYQSFIWSGLLQYYGDETEAGVYDASFKELAEDEISKADIITIHLGSNDIYANLMANMIAKERASQPLLFVAGFALMITADGTSVEEAIPEALEMAEAIGVDVSDAVSPEAILELINLVDPENLIALMSAYMSRAIESVEKLAAYIHTELNPTAEIVIVGASSGVANSLVADDTNYDLPSILSRVYEFAYETVAEHPVCEEETESFSEAIVKLINAVLGMVDSSEETSNLLSGTSSYSWNFSGLSYDEIVSDFISAYNQQVKKQKETLEKTVRIISRFKTFGEELVKFTTDYDNTYKEVFTDRYGVAYDGTSTKFPTSLPGPELVGWFTPETVYDGEELVTLSFGNTNKDGSRDVVITGAQCAAILDGSIDAEELGVIAGTTAASFVNMLDSYFERLGIRMGCDLDDFAGTGATWMNLLNLILYGLTDENGETVIEPMAFVETALQLTMQDKWGEVLAEFTAELTFPVTHILFGNPVNSALLKLNSGLSEATERLNTTYGTTFSYVDIWDAVPNEADQDPHPLAKGHKAIAEEILSESLLKTIAVTAGDNTKVFTTLRGVTANVTVSAASGYTATAVLDGASASNSFAIRNLTSDHTVVASFTKDVTPTPDPTPDPDPTPTPTPTPQKEDPVKEVPMSGEDKTTGVKVTVDEDKNTATVTSVEDDELDEVTSKSVKTGSVTIDFSNLGTDIDSAVLPSSFVTAVTEHVLDENNDVTGITLAFTDGSIELDEVATASLYQQLSASGEEDFEVTLEQVSVTELTGAQKSAIKSMDTAIVLTATVKAGNKTITNFNVSSLEGTLTFRFPFKLKSGETAASYGVYYLADDGTMEAMDSYYDETAGEMVFTTSHLSDYVLVKADASTCTKGTSCPLKEFSDLNVLSWYHDAIHYCLQNSIMQGDKAVAGTERLFRPSDSISRAELVTMLWNMDGAPDEIYRVNFNDVRTSNWYATMVAWGIKTGVVEGDNNLFRPNDSITRQEMLAMIHRFVTYKGYNVSVSSVECPDGVFTGFTDGADYSQWAKEDITWALGSGLVVGSNKNGTLLLNAKEPATRAEAAQMFMRLCQDIIAE